MAWSKIQSTSKDLNTVTSDSLAFASNNDPTSENNHIILVLVRFGNSGATFTVSDTAGNAYTPATAQASNSYEIDSGNAQTDCFALFWANAIKPNSANTVTVTAATGGSHRFSWAIAEFAPGAGLTVSLNAGPSTKQFGAGVTAFNVGPLSTTGTNQLVITGVQADGIETWTVNGPWTALENASSNGFAGTGRAVAGYQLGVGSGSYTGSITSGAGVSGSGIIIAFDAPAASPTFEDDSWSITRPAAIDPVVSVW